MQSSFTTCSGLPNASLFFRVRYTPYPRVFGLGAVALVGEMFRFDGFSCILSLILKPLVDLHYELTNLDGHLRWAVLRHAQVSSYSALSVLTTKYFWTFRFCLTTTSTSTSWLSTKPRRFKATRWLAFAFSNPNSFICATVRGPCSLISARAFFAPSLSAATLVTLVLLMVFILFLSFFSIYIIPYLLWSFKWYTHNSQT